VSAVRSDWGCQELQKKKARGSEGEEGRKTKTFICRLIDLKRESGEREEGGGRKNGREGRKYPVE